MSELACRIGDMLCQLEKARGEAAILSNRVSHTLRQWMLYVGAALFWAALMGTNAQEILVRPNISEPHWDKTKCSTCHPRIDEQDFALEYTSILDLCGTCHDFTYLSTTMHPLDVRPLAQMRDLEAKNISLVDGKIHCMSCHDILQQCYQKPADRTHNPYFLFLGAAGTMTEFCFRCHRREFYQSYDPHNQLTDEGAYIPESCVFCHTERGDATLPLTAEQYPLSLPADSTCISCHGNIPHPSMINHLLKASRTVLLNMVCYEQKDRFVLPLEKLRAYLEGTNRMPTSVSLGPEGRILCTTCHNAHENELFRAGSIHALGAEGDHTTNKRLRYAEQEMCIFCHLSKGK